MLTPYQEKFWDRLAKDTTGVMAAHFNSLNFGGRAIDPTGTLASAELILNSTDLSFLYVLLITMNVQCKSNVNL